MKITGGTLSHRVVVAPSQHTTHPMAERVRSGLFNALGDINGLTVLDPFAGSGALSFEAVSRGAIHATAIERDRNAQKIIAENITQLGLNTKVKLIRANVSAWLRTSSDTFDLILCDPPFQDLQLTLLHSLSQRLVTAGLMVINIPGRSTLDAIPHLALIKTKSYGDAKLCFFRHN